MNVKEVKVAMKEIGYEGRRALIPSDAESQEKLAEMLARPRYMMTVRHVDEDGHELCPPSAIPMPVGAKIAVMADPQLLVNGWETKEELLMVEMPAEPLEVVIEYRKCWLKEEVY